MTAAEAITWTMGHIPVILGAAAALAAAFVAVAKLTPSKKDDEIAAEAVEVVSTISSILVPKAPGAPEHTETTVTSTVSSPTPAPAPAQEPKS
jgi:hypothetical protein